MSKTTKVSAGKETSDLVLREVWRAKDELSVQYNHDLDTLFTETQKREKLSGHPLVYPPAKRRKL